MIPYGGGAPKDGGGGGGLSGAMALKKGPWTAAEDEILAAYVREHGEGNWNAVQKNTRLARCGKSCRLRWANHLRPNLKKGTFSHDEERLIIQLHAHLGNKWARMAAQLPGRTDNEIKNYWNTRQKRLQRQGLPLYPPDIVPTYQIQTQHHHQRQQQIYPQTSSQPTMPHSPLPSPTPTTPATAVPVEAAAAAASPSSFTFQTTQLCPYSPTPCPSPTTPQPPSPLPPPLSSPQQYPTLPLFTIPKSPTTTINTVNNENVFSFSRTPPPLKQPSFRFRRFNNDDGNNNCNNNIVSTTSFNANGNSLLPFSPLAKGSYSSSFTLPYSSPATPTGATSYNVNQATLLVSPFSSHLPSFSLNPSSLAPASSANALQTQFDSNSIQSTDLVQSVKPKLPSSQSFHQLNAMDLCDPTNSTNNEKHNQSQNQTNFGLRRSSSRLLEDMLEEAEALAGGRGPKRRQVSLPEDNNDNNSMPGDSGHCGSSNAIDSSPALKQNEEDLNTVQKDLEKLLDVIPFTMDALDWGSDSREISNGKSSGATDDNLELDVQQLTLLFPADPATNEHNMNPTSCSWDKLPGIC